MTTALVTIILISFVSNNFGCVFCEQAMHTSKTEIENRTDLLVNHQKKENNETYIFLSNTKLTNNRSTHAEQTQALPDFSYHLEDHGLHQQYKLKTSNTLNWPKSYQDIKRFQTEKKHRNRRRHYHSRIKHGNLEPTKLDFINDTRHNEYGYIDTNSQRFIRQAAKPTTKDNMDSIFVTPSQVPLPFNLPVQSAEMMMLPSAWPLKRSVDLDGDIFLGGLHMVHERNDANTCGPIMPQGGVQAVETMLHAIDYVNNEMSMRGEWIKNVTLGVHILDDCDTDTYGLEMAVDFIKGKYLLILFVFACTKIQREINFFSGYYFISFMIRIFIFTNSGIHCNLMRQRIRR